MRVHVYHVCWVGSEFKQVCVFVVTLLLCVYHTMISDNKLGEKGVKALIPALERLSQLEVLGLSGE